MKAILKICTGICFILLNVKLYAQGISADGKYVFVNEDKTTNYSGNILVVLSTDGLWKKEIRNGYAAKFVNGDRQLIYKLDNDEYVLDLGSFGQPVNFSSLKGENSNKKAFAVNDILPDSISTQYKFAGEIISENENRILFYLQAKSVLKIPTNYVDVWSYTDAKNQDAQLRDAPVPRKYAFCYVKATKRLVRLEGDNEKLAANYGFFISQPRVNDNYAIVFSFLDDIFTYQKNGIIIEDYSFAQYNWNKKADCDVYLVSLNDGSRKLLKKNAIPEKGNLPRYWLSPNGSYVVYVDDGNYYSYKIENGNRTKIAINNNLNNVSIYTLSDFYKWMDDDFILIKDAYSDLWKISLSNKKPPVNSTKGFFNKANEKTSEIFQLNTIQEFGKAMICRISCTNRYENDGIYVINTDTVTEPKPLIKIDGPYQYDFFQKAENKDIYLVRRQTATEPPKYFFTSDFITFHPVTSDAPDQRLEGINTEVLTWRTPDGHTTQGVLYKPQYFDSTKKYPVIFVYYESKNQPHNFYTPYGSGDLVDYGYLVFSPDIYYTLGEAGNSALNTVVSAANFLSKRKYVDRKRMGLRGGSFGGFETNYIVTHTNLFAAAISGAGYSDFISNMGSLDIGRRPHSLEGSAGQNRLGVTLWERPDIWIKNSPLFYADRVTTPLLIVHSMTDDNIPFEQNVAFFKALRYFGKRAWMLQYDSSGHIGGSFSKSIVGKCDDNCDMCTRQLQFFNHYLKGEPAPKWMLDGIPARLKGIEKGLELDLTGRTPGSGLRRDQLTLTSQQQELLKQRTIVTNDGRIVDFEKNMEEKKAIKKATK